MSFSWFGLHPDLSAALSQLSLSEPTPTQRVILPPILAGGDLLVRAPGGAGRTTALWIGLVQRLLARPVEAPRALVVTADPERAATLIERGNDLAGPVGLAVGRLLDPGNGKPIGVWVTTAEELLARRLEEADRASLEVLVLDDAEHLAPLAWADLAAALPALSQRLIFTAALNPGVREIAERLLVHPAVLEVGAPPAPAVERTEAVYPAADERKGAAVLALLDGLDESRAVIFTRTRHRANRVAEWLKAQGVSCERIHGDRTFRQRSEAIAAFKAGTFRVLVTTDLAARGLEAQPVSQLVLFDVPGGEEYRDRLERIVALDGRLSVSILLSDADESLLRAVERAVSRTLPRRDVAELDLESRSAEPLSLAETDRRGEPERRADAPRAERPRKKEQGGPRPPRSGERRHSSEEDEEARIRALAEAQQSAAVEARLSPSRMGMMDYRAPTSRQPVADKGGARRRGRTKRFGR